MSGLTTTRSDRGRVSARTIARARAHVAAPVRDGQGGVGPLPSRRSRSAAGCWSPPARSAGCCRSQCCGRCCRRPAEAVTLRRPSSPALQTNCTSAGYHRPARARSWRRRSTYACRPTSRSRTGVDAILPRCGTSTTTSRRRCRIPTDAPRASQTSPADAPVAVGIGDSLVVTTARAVEGRTSHHPHRRRRPAARGDGVDGRSRSRSGRCCRPMPRR